MSRGWIIYHRDPPESPYEVYSGNEGKWWGDYGRATIYPTREEAEKVALLIVAEHGQIGVVGVRETQ